MTNEIQNINLNLLLPFKDHPFKPRTGEEHAELLESICENGLLVPVILRPLGSGKFEIVSGHRRVEACRELGVDTVPAVVKDLSDDEAVVVMVDANLQRENLLPSEKAYAYRMKLEAMKAQGKRNDLTLSQVATKSDTATRIGEQSGESRDMVYRYIRLTNLIPELLRMVDEKRIAFTPAVEISFIPESEQRLLYEGIEFADATPSLSQAQRLRKLSENGNLSVDTIFFVLNEEKPNQKEQVRFMAEDIRKFFPKNCSEDDIKKTIIHLLEKWQRQRERKSREER